MLFLWWWKNLSQTWLENRSVPSGCLFWMFTKTFGDGSGPVDGNVVTLEDSTPVGMETLPHLSSIIARSSSVFFFCHLLSCVRKTLPTPEAYTKGNRCLDAPAGVWHIYSSGCRGRDEG